MNRRIASSALARRARWLAPLVAVGIAAGVLLTDGDTGSFALLDLRGRVVAAEAGVADAEAKRDALREQVRALRHDDIAVESRAREELGMVRDGEIVLRWRNGSEPPDTVD